ncbi:MAG: hypothetical protein C0179_04945 [Fervidicoccus sp.]|nr:MAG: hypothetical protein C0179_04945 [Fervidicoccus sp.]
MSRLVFLSALPLNSIDLRSFCIHVKRMNEDLARYIVKEAVSNRAEILSFIRHGAVADLINQLFNLNLKVNSGIYQWRRGDEIIVVSLKKQIQEQEATEILPNDLEFHYVYICEV